ncbi:MAG: hypothetical protein SGJ17_08985 [Hyphomicrobiales bacterium]|nr:hypothetical protein [Hyphomicrobiales bacterium]
MTNISVAAGISAIVLSVLTDYRFGIIKLIPFRVHLIIDSILGVAFLLVPTILGLSGIDAWYSYANAVGVLLVVLFGQTTNNDLFTNRSTG